MSKQRFNRWVRKKIVEQKRHSLAYTTDMSFFGHYKTYIFAFFADNVTILQNTVVNFRNN